MTTMRDFLNAVVSAEISDEVTEYALNQIAKLDSKNEKKRTTLSTNQKNNEEIKDKILNEMETEKIYVASELAILYELSTQKISALMKQLVTEEKVEIIDNYKTPKGKVKGYRKISV